MKVAVFTQEAPWYLPELFDQFLAANRDLDFSVYCFHGYRKSLGQELRDRLAYYGPREFSRFVIRTGAMKLGEWFLRSDHSVRRVCRKHGVACRAERGRDPNDLAGELRERQCDLLLSIACPRVLNAELLAVPAIGCLNYHTARLPRNRGRQPLFWALLRGESETAVTIHWMNEKVDGGPILCQHGFSLAGVRSLDEAYRRSLGYGLAALNEAMTLIRNRQYRRLPNPEALATRNGFPGKSDSRRFRRQGGRFF